MSEDLIKRSDAITDLCDITNNSDMPEDWHRGMSVAISALYRVPSADRPQGWIPCSERLPREEEQDDELGVLVTLGNGYSGIQYDWYHGDHWYDWDGYVLAWMPLPKPWKGADDETDRCRCAE